MSRLISKAVRTRVFIALTMVSFLVGVRPFQLPGVFAADLEPRLVKISDSTAAAHNVLYRIIFTIPTLSTIGSIRIQFCSNSSLVDDSCIAPAGFDASSTTIASQSGSTGYILSSSSTTNELILTRPPTLQAIGQASFTFTGITNPSTTGSYYARILTYASSDASGPYTDAGGLALSTSPALGVSTEVPPFLKFCLGESITAFDCTTATEAFSDLGIMSPNLTSAAQSQMVIATNASNGYSMWVSGTSMMSGSNVITPMSGGTSQKGTSQFGINLRVNTTPQIGEDPTGPGSGGVTAGYSQQNHFLFNSGDTLATAPVPDDNRKYTVSYIVNIPSGQTGGVYSTTLTYVCLANF